MPNIKSSKKDVISSKVAYEKNKAEKSALKTNLKFFHVRNRQNLFTDFRCFALAFCV